MNIRLFLISLQACLLAPWQAQAQEPVFSHEHGFYDEPFELAMEAEGDAILRYTLDGSEPSPASAAYEAPLAIGGTTIVRAAVFDGDVRLSPVTTATYLFISDILRQPGTPEGYPQTWGRYTTISGTATADYEMDPEMTNDPELRTKITEGLRSLPVVSIVTDRDNLFSHENDSVRGGIYIFTGPPVGDATGHGWTRPASVEMFAPVDSEQFIVNSYGNQIATGISRVIGNHNYSLSTINYKPNFSVTCGLRLHGGHGRLAEKNPKHSFRLVFKEKYGPKTLKYPLFGEGEPAKFDQLVLRCHFGNAWQHWDEGNRQKAQYTRDVWARRMQRRMGHTSVNALYVNLFLNGMYWGLYNLAERVDDQYGKDHLGGVKADVDVIKIEEDGGNHIEASEGTLDAWQQMATLAAIVGGATASGGFADGLSPEEAYAALQDSLLDIPAFIDYMLINQYGGNTDWDHHNWYAIRSRGADSKGFRLLCWDSEIIEVNVQENVIAKNNGNLFPTGIFHNLLHNDDFARRYVRRAKELLAPGGLLGEESVTEVWDSLHNVISKALYAEAARWGDYRRDVHRYTRQGELYTVDNQYANERNRLLTQYFPYRSENVLKQITGYVGIDDFEAPADWEKLTAQLFHEWDGNAADSQPKDKSVSVDWNMGVEAGSGTAIAGFANVEYNRYADLTSYDSLVLRGSGRGLRVLANRLTDHGPYKQIMVDFNNGSPYWNEDYQAIVLPLEDLATTPTNQGEERIDDFVHLHVLKVNWGSNARVNSAWLVPKPQSGPERKRGDVNGDGVVDVADISAIISVMAGYAEPQSGSAPNTNPQSGSAPNTNPQRRLRTQHQHAERLRTQPRRCQWRRHRRCGGHHGRHIHHGLRILTPSPLRHGKNAQPHRPERAVRLRVSIGELLAERAEVGDAGVLPLAGVLQLFMELGIDLLPSLPVYAGLGLLPDGNELLYLADTALVVVFHLLHDGAPAAQTACPRHTVEPQQEILRAGVHILVQRAVRLTILARGPAAGGHRAVEADAVVVCLVVIDRAPLYGVAGDEPVRLRAVVVVELEDVVQAYRHHVVNTGLAGAEHQINKSGRCICSPLLGGGAECLLDPLLGNIPRREVWVPCQTTEGIPVGLGEMVAAPVAVQTDVGHAGDALQTSWIDIGEELLPHRRKEHQMGAVAQILLRDLQLGHLRRLLHLVEDGGVGFARLEVERAVLRLQDDVVAELAVELGKLRDGLFHTVLALVLRPIDKGAPHHDAAVGLQRVGQHVGAVGMGAAIVEGAGLTLAVGLHEEAAEVGDELVDLLGLPLPPPLHPLVKRVGGGKVAKGLRRAEVHRQIDTQAPGAQLVGYHLHTVKIGGGEHLRRGIHIVQHRAVDADGGAGPGILCDEVGIEGEVIVPKDAVARIATLNATIGVVPVVEHAQPETGMLLYGRNRLSRLLKAKQVKGSIEQSYIVPVCFEQQAAVVVARQCETVIASLPVKRPHVGFHGHWLTMPVTTQLVKGFLYRRRRLYGAASVVP